MMTELPLEYLEQLATQFILISSLFAGFSITILANFLISKNNERFEILILKFAATAAGSFLISIFAYTDILLSVTPGYPNGTAGLNLSRAIGGIAYFSGLLCLMLIICLSKSKKTGIFTTIIGVITFVTIIVISSSIG